MSENAAIRLFRGDEPPVRGAGKSDPDTTGESSRMSESRLHTERLEDGSFESSFVLGLDAVVWSEHPSSAVAAYDAFILEHMFSALESGQRLEFGFRRSPGEYDGPSVGLVLRGSASGESAASAGHAAVALHAGLSRLLAGRDDCGFRIVDPRAEAFPFAYMVDVGGLLLTTDVKPVANARTVPVIVPAVSLVEARVPFWDALLCCTFPVQVDVSVAPVNLDGDALQALARAYVALDTPKLRCEALPERQWLNTEQVHLADGHLRNELARWLSLPAGISMNVVLRTAEALPSGALRWLAQTLLPMRRIHVRPLDSMPVPLGGAVDLRHLLNESKVMPSLLPDRDALRRIGLPQRFAAPRMKVAEQGLFLGRAADQDVRFPDADRDRHCYVVGSTGCGKSSLLLNMIRQDIEAGEGVAVIDPHGDLYRDVLASIPRNRADDAVLFDPTDLNRAVGLNYLEIPGANPSVERSFVANDLMRIFDRLYDLRRTGGPMFEQYARNAVLLLMESKLGGMTLAEVPLLFEDSEFRKHMIRHCTNPAVVRFWQRQAEEAGGEASLNNMAPYISSKFNQFTQNPLIRSIVGQSRSTIDFREVMDGRKILLVNLSKGLLGEFDSAFLGMLLVSKIFQAALGRAKLARGERRAFHLYVDEFQNFTTDTVAALLSEARKFNLRCVLANQFLKQVDTGRSAGNILGAVLGNVATILAMRVGAPDAEALSDILGGHMSATILRNLPDFHVAARMLQDGRPTMPFVFQTLKPEPAILIRATRLQITRNTLSKRSRDVGAVEREIAERVRLAFRDADDSEG